MFHVFKRPILTTSIRSMSDRAHGKHRHTANAQSMGYNRRGRGERGDFVLISGLSESFQVDS